MRNTKCVAHLIVLYYYNVTRYY